jgi:hypothetical protein
LTWSAASVSGTDAVAMSGCLASAGFEGAGSGSGLLGVVRIVNIVSGARPVYAGLPARVAPNFNGRFPAAPRRICDVLLMLDQLVPELLLEKLSSLSSVSPNLLIVVPSS